MIVALADRTSNLSNRSTPFDIIVYNQLDLTTSHLKKLTSCKPRVVFSTKFSYRVRCIYLQNKNRRAVVWNEREKTYIPRYNNRKLNLAFIIQCDMTVAFSHSPLIQNNSSAGDVSVAIDLGHEISVRARYSANVERVDNDRYKRSKCATSTGMANATGM